MYAEWIHRVGNPDPTVIIFKAHVSRSLNAEVELVSTVWDDLVWDWLVSHVPSFKNNQPIAAFLIEDQAIVVPSNAFSLDKNHPRKGILADGYFFGRQYADADFSVLYKNAYSGLRTRSPVKVYSGFKKRIDTLENFLFSTRLAEVHFPQIAFPDCFGDVLLFDCSAALTPLPHSWLCMVEYDTFYLHPSSQVGIAAKYVQQPKNNPYPKLSYPNKYIGYRLLTRFSAGASCWEKSKLVSYLIWYTESSPQGYERKTHLGKAYYLDTQSGVLVIGEQNPTTGEWQGDFEAYSLSLDADIVSAQYEHTPILFMKGRHDKNKRVGEWEFYSLYELFDAKNLTKKVDYMDAEGNFLRSEKVPYSAPSQAELLKYKQTVQPFLEKK